MWLQKYAETKTCRFIYAFYRCGSNLALILEMKGNFWGIFNEKITWLDLYFEFTRDCFLGSTWKKGCRRISLWGRTPGRHPRDINSLEQRLKERLPRHCPTWGFITYTVTKPRHYCGCQEVNAERSLVWLSPEKPCQSLTNTETDIRSQPLDWARGP